VGANGLLRLKSHSPLPSLNEGHVGNCNTRVKTQNRAPPRTPRSTLRNLHEADMRTGAGLQRGTHVRGCKHTRKMHAFQ
jgi:hypothetical protein